VAAGSLTTLFFNAFLERDSLELDRTRFKLVDVGERSINLLPATELGSGERLVLKVRFKDRALPSQAVFALVSHPSEVDGSVEVERRSDTSESLQAALAQKDAELETLKVRCTSIGPAGFVLSGVIDKYGIRAIPSSVSALPENGTGLRVTSSTTYRAMQWAAVRLEVSNLPNQQPWSPGSTRLTGPKGALVKVLAVRMEPPILKPGDSGLLVVETEPIDTSYLSGPFHLEVMDRDASRPLPIGGLSFR
jgi:uncharacterized protein (TIGR02268 family)